VSSRLVSPYPDGFSRPVTPETRKDPKETHKTQPLGQTQQRRDSEELPIRAGRVNSQNPVENPVQEPKKRRARSRGGRHHRRKKAKVSSDGIESQLPCKEDHVRFVPENVASGPASRVYPPVVSETLSGPGSKPCRSKPPASFAKPSAHPTSASQPSQTQSKQSNQAPAAACSVSKPSTADPSSSPSRPRLVATGSQPPTCGSLASLGRGLHAVEGSNQNKGIPEPPASGLHASPGRVSLASGGKGGGVPKSDPSAGVLHASKTIFGRGSHAAKGADRGSQPLRAPFAEGLYASSVRGSLSAQGASPKLPPPTGNKSSGPPARPNEYQDGRKTATAPPSSLPSRPSYPFSMKNANAPATKTSGQVVKQNPKPKQPYDTSEKQPTSSTQPGKPVANETWKTPRPIKTSLVKQTPMVSGKPGSVCYTRLPLEPEKRPQEPSKGESAS
jgi:hypothetical protein